MAMHMFFEVRIRYEKTMENGQNKRSMNLIWSTLSALQKRKLELLTK